MIGKLPVIGKRYKGREDKKEFIISEITDDGYVEWDGGVVAVEYFIRHYDKLPDQEPTNQEFEDMQRKDDNLIDPSIVGFKTKVNEDGDIEETKKLMYEKPYTKEAASSKSENSLHKSIWKPISELPAGGKYVVIIRAENRSYLAYVDGHNIKTKQCNLVYIDGDQVDQNHVKSVCTLNDFINRQESLEERITKLENKND